MKTKSGKKLLITCIVLTATTIVLALSLVFYNPNKVIPNKDKFTLNRDTYDWITQTPIGNAQYCIDNLRYEPALIIRHPSVGPGTYEILLDYMLKHKVENEIFYCYADDGFAVVYPESNLCKVFITPPTRYLDDASFSRIESNEYRVRKVEADDFPENKLVVYLDSFDEFTEYEQKMLKSLE